MFRGGGGGGGDDEDNHNKAHGITVQLQSSQQSFNSARLFLPGNLTISSSSTASPAALPGSPNGRLTTASSTADSPRPTDAVYPHFYFVGFRQGMYHDFLLHILPTPYHSAATFKLHRLVLAQSPFFAPHLEESHEMEMSILDPFVEGDSLAVALGWLYSKEAVLGFVTPKTAKGILAAAYLFRLDDLCEIALKELLTDVTLDTVLSYVSVCETQPDPSADVSSNGPADRYGKWSGQLKKVLVDYLTNLAPASLLTPVAAGGGGGGVSYHETMQSVLFHRWNADGLLRLVDLYAGLSYEWFKRVIEHVDVGNGANERFEFGKLCVARRREIGTAAGWEENVVVAFGKSGGRVTIRRRKR